MERSRRREGEGMICDRCRHADAVGGFPDGQDMFVCNMQDDPRVPFNMEEDTEECPCFEEATE